MNNKLIYLVFFISSILFILELILIFVPLPPYNKDTFDNISIGLIALLSIVGTYLATKHFKDKDK